MKISFVISALFVFTLCGILLLNSCGKKETFVYRSATPLPFATPVGFPQPTHDFQNRPLTEEGFALGKKLFYEGKLARDTVNSCGSCHQPAAAFTTFEHDLSHGINNSHTIRNAPGLFNLAWYPAFLQDGSVRNLETVSLSHINSPIDMGESVSGVVAKLQADSVYRQLFKAAYGDMNITSDRLLDALKQFVLGMVSANSKYDRVKRGEASFTVQEQTGYTLFQTKCASCHAEPLFTDFSYRNTGLDIHPNIKDYGRMRVTKDKADSLKFRVPSLRNLFFTSYYGHDGRFSNVQAMIGHYRSGVIVSPTLDPALINGIPTSTAEQAAIISFLRTLSDSSFLNNPRYRP
ncbi:MAG: cytochrome-c peroxidase [Flaviaesturariibacter sp.]|nr:cytochrome-c peroxidase [Flaviaesturariibacter sp.]